MLQLLADDDELCVIIFMYFVCYFSLNFLNSYRVICVSHIEHNHVHK